MIRTQIKGNSINPSYRIYMTFFFSENSTAAEMLSDSRKQLMNCIDHISSDLTILELVMLLCDKKMLSGNLVHV